MGTGGVGGYYGARMQDAGHDVTFLARGRNLEALQGDGLRVRSVHGDLDLPELQAVEKAEEPADACLICVKTYDNDSAAAAMESAVAEGTTLVSLQNGVDNERFWGERFPRGVSISLRFKRSRVRRAVQ